MQALPKIASTFPFFFPAPPGRLRVKRLGHSLLRSAAIPKPLILVDTREQQPWALHANHRNWIAGERRAKLKTGDYSIEGMEGLLALERKNLADLVDCTVTSRERFIRCCSRLAKFRWKAIVIEASYEDIKAGWDTDEIQSNVHPNSVCGLLDAIDVGWAPPTNPQPKVGNAHPTVRTRSELALQALHLLVAGAATQGGLRSERAASWLSSISPTGGWSRTGMGGC